MPSSSPATADLFDSHGERLRVCDIRFYQYGRMPRFHGPIRTLKTFEDNAFIKATLSAPGGGSVLVVDGGGSLRCALVGDVIAGSAASNGWAGLVIWGAVRDSVALAALDIGIKAMGTNPSRSGKTGAGQVDVPLHFGGVMWHTGAWLYSDEDGIVLSETCL